MDSGYILEAVLKGLRDVGVKFPPILSTINSERNPEEEHLSCVVGWAGRTLASYFGTVMKGSPVHCCLLEWQSNAIMILITALLCFDSRRPERLCLG